MTAKHDQLIDMTMKVELGKLIAAEITWWKLQNAEISLAKLSALLSNEPKGEGEVTLQQPPHGLQLYDRLFFLCLDLLPLPSEILKNIINTVIQGMKYHFKPI